MTGRHGWQVLMCCLWFLKLCKFADNQQEWRSNAFLLLSPSASKRRKMPRKTGQDKCWTNGSLFIFEKYINSIKFWLQELLINKFFGVWLIASLVITEACHLLRSGLAYFHNFDNTHSQIWNQLVTQQGSVLSLCQNNCSKNSYIWVCHTQSLDEVGGYFQEIASRCPNY